MKPTASVLRIFMTLLALAAMSLPAAAKKGEEMKVPKPGELVWPPPPQQPRVRYIREITQKSNFVGEKKRSFLDRLMGETQEKEKRVLETPYGIAIGKDERIYIADSEKKAVTILDRRDLSITEWKGNSQISLSIPVGLALGDNSRLFVSDSKAARVVIFNQEGTPESAFGDDIMQRPVGLAVDNSRGRLYVGDIKLHKVLVYNLKTLKLIKQIGGKVGSGESAPDSLSTPTNLALDREGNIFVSDTLQCRVVVFNPEGEFVRSFGDLGDMMGEFARPKGIAIDSEGHVYVVDAAFGNIQIFNPDGKLLLIVSSGGAAPGYLNLPTGIAIDSQDRIYVTEHWSRSIGRLQIFEYLPENKQSSAKNVATEIR